MIVLLTAASAFILSIVVMFFDIFIIKILLSLFVIVVVALQLSGLIRRARKDSVSEDISKDLSDREEQSIAMAARLKELENSNRELAESKVLSEKRIETLLEDVSYLCTALPLMKRLADLVIGKTEESAMNLTENIFQISTQSSRVGGHISNYLVDLFSGEKSLKRNIEILKMEMERIDLLIEDFSAIKKRYTVDMKHIEENVKTINGFLSGIRDVSDRTGLLAINSSIEAARVGTAGRGFSVLAGEIQGLASSSRELSLKIDEVVEGISSRVEESFETLESEIGSSLGSLRETQTDLREISLNLDEKILEIEDHVRESDVLAKTVTEQLNNVSVNMQYQDITRQILEHVMAVLEFYRKRIEEKEPVLIAETGSRAKKERVIEKARTYFTIEDEWKLFGLDHGGDLSAVTGGNEEFKGDVELF